MDPGWTAEAEQSGQDLQCLLTGQVLTLLLRFIIMLKSHQLTLIAQPGRAAPRERYDQGLQCLLVVDIMPLHLITPPYMSQILGS